MGATELEGLAGSPRQKRGISPPAHHPDDVFALFESGHGHGLRRGDVVGGLELPVYFSQAQCLLERRACAVTAPQGGYARCDHQWMPNIFR